MFLDASVLSACPLPICFCSATEVLPSLTPGFCLNPDCTLLCLTLRACLLTIFACLTLDFCLNPTCTFARIFWLDWLWVFYPAACAWPVLPVFCFFLTVNKYPNFRLLPSLPLGPQSLPASLALTVRSGLYCAALLWGPLLLNEERWGKLCWSASTGHSQHDIKTNLFIWFREKKK